MNTSREDTNIPLGANGVDLVDENDTQCVPLSHTG